MCGIAGFLRRAASEDAAAVGDTLLEMSLCLQHRGSDSAGIALFSPWGRRMTLSVRLGCGGLAVEPQTIYHAAGRDISNIRPTATGFTVSVHDPSPENVGAVVASLERNLPGAVVTGAGHSMVIEKEVGTPETLRNALTGEQATHGIAHLRMATESRIDPAHAQPFWGRPYADVAVSHNGHVTNYDRLRTLYEGRGFTFASENDSEVIGVLVGEALSAGLSLEHAVRDVTGRLDGSFAFLVATSAGIAAARDPFATKPLLYAENSECVALASEQQPLQRLFQGSSKIREIHPREVRVWEKG